METERTYSRLNFNITCGINKNVKTTCRCLDFRAPPSNLLLLPFFSMFLFLFHHNFRITISSFINTSLPTGQKNPYPQSLFQSHERERERERERVCFFNRLEIALFPVALVIAKADLYPRFQNSILLRYKPNKDFQ